MVVVKRLAVALVAVLLLVACSGPPRRVAVVGDSISFLVGARWEQRLRDDGFVPVKSSAVPGISISQSFQAASEIADAGPDDVVVNLGSNDAGGMVPVDISKAAYVDMLRKFRGCIVVVTLTERHGNLEFVQPFNAWLRDVGTLRATVGNDRVFVVDWAAALDAHPDWTPDSVHPAGPGVDGYVDTVRQGLDNC